MCVYKNYMYIYIYIYTYPIYIYIYIYIMCNTIEEYGFCSYSYGIINIFKLILYFTVEINQVKHSNKLSVQFHKAKLI